MLMRPKYPIYIPSKGRWDSRHTARKLKEMGVDYRLVVEAGEYEKYARHEDENNLLVRPESCPSLASVPTRNFIWEHAKSAGARRHWCIDDNINGFMRLNRNRRTPCRSGAIFRAVEDFVDRYSNIALAGLEYRFMSGGARRKKPPYRINTRIYSCILLDTLMPFRWRGWCNEDTDLSLRVLKDGRATVLFNAFLCNKAASMTVKGGNTDALYSQHDDNDPRKAISESLRTQHPDCVEVVRRWGRFHHHIDYRPFRNNPLTRRPDYSVKEGVDEFGMILRRTGER